MWNHGPRKGLHFGVLNVTGIAKIEKKQEKGKEKKEKISELRCTLWC